MDRQTAKKLKGIIVESVQKAIDESDLNLTLKISSGTFGKSNFAVKITLLEQGKDGMAIGGEVDTFLKRSYMYGVPKEWLNRKFQDRKKTFTVTGMTPRRCKNCFILQDEKGKEFRVSGPNLIAVMKT